MWPIGVATTEKVEAEDPMPCRRESGESRIPDEVGNREAVNKDNRLLCLRADKLVVCATLWQPDKRTAG